jgi:DNA-binding HxlR family transcriptional regulator
MTGESDWQATWHSLHALLGRKWTLHVLRLLSTGSHGFNEMKRELDGVTATMLSRRLEELACHGLVDRTVEETTPPSTTYRLTERGATFADRLRELEWLVQRGRCEDDACVDAGEECVTVAPCCE